ncbi:MAG TPA: Ig-like domain-containing protein, partial [Thermoanaerobaculia bacterium]|nr:Ig-like domain-containing protein [Thermoanaerobaculia bacterium]
MSQFRVTRVSLALLLVCAFPLIASAATTDFRVLFDVDHDVATGCTVSTMPGVDQVFTTRVETTASTATVTQTFRQVCTGTSLGPQILIENLGWPAGFQSSSGQLLVETRIPFSSFPETTTPRNMRIGLVGSQGTTVHTALTRPNGDLVFFPAPARSRRRAVAAPGGPRVITLDGIGTDWNGLKAMFDGIGASGVPGMRIEKFFGFADTNFNILYFRFDANLSNSAPFAANDFYTRAIGSGLTVPGVNGDPTVLENDTDPHGLPLTATLVSQPPGGQVVLDSTGGFTYTPTDPNSEDDDSFEYRASNGTQDSNVATVTISPQDVEVSGPNQEPSFDKGSDPVVLEDSGPQSIPNWATNITAGPDEDDDQTVTFVVTNVTNPSLFDTPPSISPNGTLTFTPAVDAFGNSTVTVKITDDGGVEDGGDNESPTQTFFITVDVVNDAPSFTPGPPVVVEDNDGAQNLPWATGMSPGPANESGQVLDFIIDSNSNPALFSVQPTIAPNGTLSFTPAPGQSGFANITVLLHDDGGTANGGVDTSAGVQLTLTVEKAPLITSANNTTFTVGTAGSFTVTTNGIPRPSISMTGTLPAGVTFVDGTGANKGTGVLSGTPAPGTGGVYNLTFQATNVRGSSPIQNFTLTVNQPPAITTAAEDETVCEGETATFTAAASGTPAPTVQWSVSTNGGASFTDISGATTDTLSFPANTSQSGNQYRATFTNTSGSAQTTATLTVNANPASTITPSPLQVCANSTGNTADGPGGMTTYAWSIVNGTITSAANIQTITDTAGASGTVDLTLVVTNAAGCSATNTVNVTINATPTSTITPTPAQVCANSTGNTADGP